MGDAWQNPYACARLKRPVSGSCLQLRATGRDPLPRPAVPVTLLLHHQHEPHAKEMGLGYLVPGPITTSPLYPLVEEAPARAKAGSDPEKRLIYFWRGKGFAPAALRAQRAGEGTQEGFQCSQVCAGGQEGARGERDRV